MSYNVIPNLKTSIGAGLFGLVMFATTPALACDSAFYNHNGSTMEVHVCDGKMVIEYDRPKSSLRKHGVRAGTVLFRGEVYDMGGDGSKINGRAKVFKRNCGSRSYEVNGWMQGNRITMAGRAPVRGGDCQVKRRRNDNLVFNGQ